MKIITRKEARARGLKRYFTGKLCKHGHVAERLVSVRNCLECAANTREIPAARKRFRTIMELLDPLPKVTAERYSDIWMEEVDTRNFCLAFREMDEEKFVAQLRRVGKALNPPPKVTSPEDTAMSEEQLRAQSVRVAKRKRTKGRNTEDARRQARQKLIDELLADSNRFARRQRTIENLWRTGHFKESPDERWPNNVFRVQYVAKTSNEKHRR